MLYTPEEWSKIEKLRQAFSNYIDNSPNFDLLYSHKVGLICLALQQEGAESAIADFAPERIRTADQLAELLFREITSDVCFAPGSSHMTSRLSQEEQDEAQRRIAARLDDMEEGPYYLQKLEEFFENYSID